MTYFRPFLISLLFTSSLIGIGQGHFDDSFKTKKIELISFESKQFLAYENRNALIFIDKFSILNALKKKLKNKRLCDLKRTNYLRIAIQLSKNDSSYYVIETVSTPNQLWKFGEIPTIDGNNKDLRFDNAANSYRWILENHFIPPYGYMPMIDTLGLLRLDKHFDWMISDFVLSGHAKVYNKKLKKFEKEVILEVVDLDGHGGESLLFTDSTRFFNVIISTDIVVPDIECGEKIEF